MTMEEDMLLIKSDYEALLKEHGTSKPESVGWSSEWEQWRRYNVLVTTPEHRSSLSNVLEVGCGRGGLMQTPKTGGFESYVGLDLVPENIEYCKSRYSYDSFEWVCTDAIPWLSDTPRKFETVLASGVLARYNSAMAHALLTRMFFVVKEGGYMGFNWNRATCGITSRDMLTIISDCGVERFVLRHDYIPNDYTVLCYK